MWFGIQNKRNTNLLIKYGQCDKNLFYGFNSHNVTFKKSNKCIRFFLLVYSKKKTPLGGYNLSSKKILLFYIYFFFPYAGT